MDIHVVEVFGRGILEKLLPKRGKVEVGVGEEEESNLEFGVCKFGLRRVRTLGLLKVF